MDGDGALAAASSDDGMAGLDRDGFGPALLRLVGPWLGDGETPVLACGMVGARQGWVEAPYAEVPASPAGVSPVEVPQGDGRIRVHVVPGLMQREPADVMRGEETQVAGFLSSRPGWEGVACLPGTHSKWVETAGGEVTGFSTFMTGELFALLREASVLRHSLGEDGWDGEAFDEAVSQALEGRGGATGLLFSVRARGLVGTQGGAAARARLSGLLIGAEVSAARDLCRGRPVAAIGDEGISARYARAIGMAGMEAEAHDATKAVLAGLSAQRRAMAART